MTASWNCGSCSQLDDCAAEAPRVVIETNAEAGGGRKSTSAAGRLSTSSAALRPRKDGMKEKLLDKYVLGTILGHGAFGVVYSCKTRTSGEEFAVKMIDQVETTLKMIKREVEMLRRLAHPCVTKIYDVYYEKVFVCVVMEKYDGGDMIENMQSHFENHGLISVGVAQNICKQLMQGVDFLHGKQVVHRDLKGDNFLLDQRGLERTCCRIFLSDFGTVVDLPPGQRLDTACGTKPYWSPEFYRLDYSHAVDMWAIGVVVFSLITAKFCFKSQQETEEKRVELPSRATPEGIDFCMGLLEREEANRLTAREALEHPYLSSVTSAAELAECTHKHEGFKTQLREAGANMDVQERRLELVERLGKAAGTQHRLSLRFENEDNMNGKASIGMAIEKSWCDKLRLGDVSSFLNNFQVENRNGTQTTFEWWSKDKGAGSAGCKVTDLSKAKKIKNINEMANTISPDGIRQMLEDHGIDTSQFGQGKAKKFDDLVKELQNGSCRLMLDASQHKSIVRVVDLTLLRVSHGIGENRRYLVKTGEQYFDGRLARGDLNHVPGTKKLPHQSSRQVFEFVMEDRIGLCAAKPEFDWINPECFEEDEMSVSYPGVRTVYRKELFEVNVGEEDPEILKRYGLAEDGVMRNAFKHVCSSNVERQFMWYSAEEMEARNIMYNYPPEGQEVSPFCHAPIGMGEQDLEHALRSVGIDVTKFGVDGAKTLAEFSKELIKGDSQLAQKPDGSVIRLVDVVMLKIINSRGDVLVAASERAQNGGESEELGCLPVVKRRPDEHPLYAGRRVLSRILRVNENMVRMDEKSVRIVEEESISRAHAGMLTVVRQFVIPTVIDEGLLATIPF